MAFLAGQQYSVRALVNAVDHSVSIEGKTIISVPIYPAIGDGEHAGLILQSKHDAHALHEAEQKKELAENMRSLEWRQDYTERFIGDVVGQRAMSPEETHEMLIFGAEREQLMAEYHAVIERLTNV